MLELLLLALPRPAESPTRTPRASRCCQEFHLGPRLRRTPPSTSPSPLPEPPAASPQARREKRRSKLPDSSAPSGWGWAVRPGASEPCDYIGGFSHAGHGNCTDPATGKKGLGKLALVGNDYTLQLCMKRTCWTSKTRHMYLPHRRRRCRRRKPCRQEQLFLAPGVEECVGLPVPEYFGRTAGFGKVPDWLVLSQRSAQLTCRDYVCTSRALPKLQVR